MDAKTLDAMAESTPEYEAFVEKFKPKKTTDDCYTPENIYDVVAGWVEKEYGVSRENFIRPFYPGGDYEHEDYPAGCIVVDNPPFSMLARIVKFYNENRIKFFLFAPTLTCLGSIKHTDGVCVVVTGVDILYDNDATVSTSFVTNMDTVYRLVTCPDLAVAVEKANEENSKERHQQLPTYAYPDYVLTAALAKRYCKYGVELKIRQEDCVHIGALDAQKAKKKTVFGYGLLLSERAAAERAAAERAAAERAAAEKKNTIVWELSEREKEIVRNLGKAETAA